MGCVSMTCVCRRAGHHRRATCSAEIVIQDIHSCDPDRRSKVPSGQMTEIYLEKIESRIGERGIYSDEGGIRKGFAIRAE
jgi:hypothetical protein